MYIFSEIGEYQSHLRKPAQENEVEDGVENADDDVEDADKERGEEEDLLGLHHPKDDCGVDNNVGERPDDRPDPVS